MKWYCESFSRFLSLRQFADDRFRGWQYPFYEFALKAQFGANRTTLIRPFLDFLLSFHRHISTLFFCSNLIARERVKTDITIIQPQIINELIAHNVCISFLILPPSKVIISVYCKERTDTSASTKLIFRNILMLKWLLFRAFIKCFADIVTLYVV